MVTMYWTIFCLKSTYSSKFRRINSVELKNDALLRMHQSLIQSSMWSYLLINCNTVIFPSKQVWSRICINLNSHYPRSFMPSFVEISQKHYVLHIFGRFNHVAVKIKKMKIKCTYIFWLLCYFVFFDFNRIMVHMFIQTKGPWDRSLTWKNQFK